MCFSCYDVYPVVFNMVTGVLLQHQGEKRQFVCLTPRPGSLGLGTAKFRAEQTVPRRWSRGFNAGNGGVYSIGEMYSISGMGVVV